MGNTIPFAASENDSDKRDGTGALIINADDWGRNRETTDRISECFRRKAVSSVSAMVFMEDSSRAAAIAIEQSVDAGLHLNFTSSFSGPRVPDKLAHHHQKIASYLRRHRVNQAIFHPGLMSSFRYVISAQLEEYALLYGSLPTRLDGHHHMHLCANVLLGALLPAGTIVRRNFSFQEGEKGIVNRSYRRLVDRLLARRHGLSDFFYSLTPLEPADRLLRIFSLSRRCIVEVETHPVEQAEYDFLTGTDFLSLTSKLPLAARYARRANGN